jgi:hypothetical protein
MNRLLSLLLALALVAGAVAPAVALAGSEMAAQSRSSAAPPMPDRLEDAIAEIKAMVTRNAPMTEIAARVTAIANHRVVNANTLERMTVGANWLSVFKDSEQEKAFDAWRKAGGAEQQVGAAARWVWDSRYGECAENSALVYTILKGAGVNNVRLMHWEKHRFVVFGMDEEADHNDPASWTDDVFVPDGWQGKSLRGRAAYNNGWITGAGARQLFDKTHVYDRGARERCGFLGSPCCKRIPACRAEPSLVCLLADDKCHPCGKIAQYCCENRTCDPGLSCNEDNRCAAGSAEPVKTGFFRQEDFDLLRPSVAPSGKVLQEIEEPPTTDIYLTIVPDATAVLTYSGYWPQHLSEVVIWAMKDESAANSRWAFLRTNALTDFAADNNERRAEDPPEPLMEIVRSTPTMIAQRDPEVGKGGGGIVIGVHRNAIIRVALDSRVEDFYGEISATAQGFFDRALDLVDMAADRMAAESVAPS